MGGLEEGKVGNRKNQVKKKKGRIRSGRGREKKLGETNGIGGHFRVEVET